MMAVARRPEPQRRQLAQTYLDVGQRDFHSYRCPVCGMLYARGVDAGERACGRVWGGGSGGGGSRHDTEDASMHDAP